MASKYYKYFINFYHSILKTALPDGKKNGNLKADLFLDFH